MDKGKGSEGAISISANEETDTYLVSSTIHDDIVYILDGIERTKLEEEEDDIDLDLFEKTKSNLTIMLRLVQLSSPNFDSRKSYQVLSEDEDVSSIDHLKQVLLRLIDCIKTHASSEHHSKSYSTLAEEQLIEILDSLLMNIDLESVRYVTLQNVCRLVRFLHWLKVNNCAEPEIVKYVIPQFQLMGERVEHLCWVLLADNLLDFLDFDEEFDFHRDENKLAHLLVMIIHVGLEVIHSCFSYVKASKSTDLGHFIEQLVEVSPGILKESLIHLQDHMVNVASSSTSSQKIHLMVEFLLLILTDIPKDFIYLDKLFDLLVHVEEVIKEVSILVRRIDDKLTDEESTTEMDCRTMYLLENIERLKGDLKHVYLKAPNQYELCFQMGDGQLFMSLLLGHLKGLFNSNAALIKEEIGIVKEDLEFIRSFFGKVEQELCKDLWKRILEVAYEVKYAINSIVVRDDGLLHIIFSLPNAREKIKLIKDEVSNLHGKISKNSSIILKQPPVKNKSFLAGQIMVGFKEERDWIIRKLTDGPRELDVISVIGMPGLGKTTLAYNVYNDRSVISHFDIRAWCTIDQEYDRKLILQKILNQVTGLDEKFKDDTDVDDILRKKLYARRCLIFLDDLWDTASWDDLTRPFLQVEKGSRIVLTSRNKEVALHGKRHSDPLELRLLRPEESWELLERRIFQEESCPVELQGVGKQIAQNCQGLPLFVDVIAGVIRMSEKEKIVWLEILKDLKAFIFNDEEKVMKVIQWSYDKLTDHQKLCFLYLGSYKKDEQIKADELKALWSAEGFVEEIEMKSVEEVIENYLDRLVSSSLVILSKGRYGDKVYQLHDLIHDFCLIKARKDKMFDLIRLSDTSSPSYSGLMPRQLTIEYSELYRDLVMFNLVKEKDFSCNNLLSLKLTGGSNLQYISFSHMCRLRHFRLLRVLNISNGCFHVTDSLLNEIAMLVHLRYLKLNVLGIEALPLSFANLLNLETLVVNTIVNRPMLLEPAIWNLAMLRYVNITPSCCLYDLRRDEPTLLAGVPKFENMRVLKWLKFSCSKGRLDIIKRFPNLQKLHCTFMKTWDSSAGRDWFPQFGFLNVLEELKVHGDPNGKMSFEAKALGEFTFFPLSLRYLQLGYCIVSSDSLSTIARLPNLEKLELRYLQIQGKEWKMQDNDTFKNLKFLNMCSVCFSEWQIGEEQFPVLEHLIFQSCKELKEIPPSFGDICSLKSIELLGNPQLVNSAFEIKRYVEDVTGDDKLQLILGYQERKQFSEEFGCSLPDSG